MNKIDNCVILGLDIGGANTKAAVIQIKDSHKAKLKV